MTEFTKTNHCRLHVHCRTCRDRENGRGWREQIAAHFAVDEIDWPCPDGRPWGYEGQSRGLGDTVAKFIKTVTRGRVRPCRGCKKRQRVLNALVPYRQGV